MNRIITLLTILVSLGSYAQSFTIDQIVYNVTSSLNKEVEIVGYNGGGGAITIPSTVTSNSMDYTVTSIGSYIFSGRSLTSIDVPSTVTSIGSGAFQSNNFTSVTIPEGITSIGVQVFANCALLTSVTIPEGITSIGEQAFANCSQLTSLTLPESLISIGTLAFSNCKITDLTLPENLGTISSQAFSNNPLDTVSLLGSTPPTLGSGSFGYGDLSSIDFLVVSEAAKTAYESDPTWSGSVGEVTVDEEAFTSVSFDFEGLSYEVVSDTEVKVLGKKAGNTDRIIEIPSSVTHDSEVYSVVSIGNSAFESSNLIDVTIPASITSIGDSAFFDNAIREITVLNETPMVLDNNAFEDANLIILYVSSPSVIDTYKNALVWKDFEEIAFKFEVGEFVYSISSATATSTTIVGKTDANTDIDITIPSLITYDLKTYSVTRIANYAFYKGGLTNVSFPSSITDFGRRAFDDNNLTSVALPSSLKEIGEFAFSNNNLTIIDFPSSIEVIDTGAFRYNDLQEVVFPSGITTLSAHLFSHNDIQELTLPDGLTDIGAFAFIGNKLTEISIPSSVTSIGDSAFGRNNIDTVTAYNESPVSVVDYVFGDVKDALLNVNSLVAKQAYESANVWKEFGEIVSPDTHFNYGGLSYFVVSNEDIEVQGRAEGDMTTDIVIPSTVTYNGIEYTVVKVASKAFDDNNLTTVTLPSSLKEIGEFAFSNNNLTIIDFPSLIEVIDIGAFRYNNIQEVVFPSGITSLSAHLFSHNDIQELTLPDGLTDIGRFAFIGNKLTEISIPSSVTSIGNSAFGRNNIDTVTVYNESPVAIVDYVFGFIKNAVLNVNSLVAKQAYESADVWKEFGEIVSPDTHFNYGGLSYFVVSNEEIEVQGRAEGDMTTDIVIPSTVTYNDIEYTVVKVASKAFDDNNLTSVVLPSSLKEIGEFAFSNNNLTIIDFPSSIEVIGIGAFRYNELQEVVFPTGITTLSAHLFSHNDIQELTLPDGLIDIGRFAFIGNKLTEIIIPSSVTSIGDSAFGRNNIDTVTVHNESPVSVVDYVFGYIENAVLNVKSLAVKQAYEGADVWKGFGEIKAMGVGDNANSPRAELFNSSNIEVTFNTVSEVALEDQFSVKNYQNKLELVTESSIEINKLLVYDMNGGFVKASNSSVLDVLDLKNSIYILIVNTTQGEFVKRFVK